ncbi:MAG TPA: hypothetical protein VK421_19860 [Pyrinomonadaceae bacterium]|nr:hypothetical protein [Pyrinomonadaceae bacterium]
MEYVWALSVHFAALALLFTGAMGLIAASVGDVSYESEMSFFTITSEVRGRKLNALLGSFCVLAGGGVLLLAVREFRPPSYPLFLLGSLGGMCLMLLMFKLALRSPEAMESAMAKGILFLVNGLILALLLLAAACLGAYLWRALITA